MRPVMSISYTSYTHLAHNLHLDLDLSTYKRRNQRRRMMPMYDTRVIEHCHDNCQSSERAYKRPERAEYVSYILMLLLSIAQPSRYRRGEFVEW
jgi:hypothetical protein